jgi:hypothetical protein
MSRGRVPVVMPGRMRLRRFVEGQTWTLTDVPTAEIVHISVLLRVHRAGGDVACGAGEVSEADGVAGWLGQRVAGSAGGWVSGWLGQWDG